MATQTLDALSVTWNNGATSFNAIKMDVTDTASAETSDLLDLQVGSSSVLNVRKDGQVIITSADAAALAVGPNGATNPVLQADASTSSAATGIEVTGKAATAGVAISVISSGTNESLDIDAKGSGTIDLAGNSTGAVTYATNLVGTSTSANALTVGENGTTNPAFNVDASAGTTATGINIAAAAAASGVALSVLSSGTNEALSIDAKGSGAIALAGTSTGAVTVGSNVVATTTSANALTVGANGTTNPQLNVQCDASSVATGLDIIGNAAGSGVEIAALSSGTNENIKITPKGTGNLDVDGGLIVGHQALSGAGAVDVSSVVTFWTTTSADAGTLADGTVGQIKKIVMVADGGDGTLTPTNFGNGSTITFADVGDAVELSFDGTNWWVVGSHGSPAIA